jgi:TolB-like protein/Tfp pilus assembly protein PilF
MVESSRPSIQIDLNEFKLHLYFKGRTQLTLHFNSPSRRFYLSVIALVVNEMKKSGKIKSIPLQEHLNLLALLNESIGGAAGSSDKENLLHRIYTKWKDALPNLEEAPLFKVLGRKKEEGDGAIGKVYSFTDVEKDGWANLFEYMGSNENVRLKFSIDKIGVGLNEASIIFGDFRNESAWDQFIFNLKNGKQAESGPMEEAAVSEAPAAPSPSPAKRRLSWISGYRWLMLVAVIGVVAGAIWQIYFSHVPIEAASVARMKYPLPDKPSIAVLPFVNMNEDPKQEFLSDGITESIITALSKVPSLFVISQDSTFVYKGNPVKIKRVSEDLGVRYVLKGSVQRSGDRARITAQLIDALAGNQIWAERYERDLKDIFALQDDITLRVLTAIQVKLTDGEQASMSEKSYQKYLTSKQGLDCYLKGLEAIKCALGHNIETLRAGRRIAEDGVAMCPEIPTGYVGLGYVYLKEYWLGSGKSSLESIEKGIEMAQKALAMDDSIASAHALLSNLYAIKREYDRAIAEGERAIALSPGSAMAFELYAQSLNYAGRSDEAIPLLQKAIRLNPFSPTHTFLFLGHSFRMTGKLEESASAFEKAIERAPDSILAHLGLAATYSLMGREKEARAEVDEVLKINPKFSLDNYAKLIPYKDQSDVDQYINALRKAGLK